MNISKRTLQFLKDLKSNNNKDWFAENKKIYEEARAEFIVFVDALILEIAKFDPSIKHNEGKKSVFRIYRDVRFSKDKSPYKTNFGAHITAAEKKSEVHTRAGYYINITPGGCMLAGGAYLPQGKWLKEIREEIAYRPDEFKKIINSANFKKYFGAMEGEQLKKAPKDFPIDHPEIELLRYKSFLAVHNMKDAEVLNDGFLKHAASVFKALKPFDDFLNSAID